MNHHRMNHVLILAHSPLASALRIAALHVLPDCAEDLQALDVSADKAPEITQTQAEALLRQWLMGSPPGSASKPPTHPGSGCLILTDVVGATPCNIATRLQQAHPQSVALLCGVNLSMLIRALSHRHENLHSLCQYAEAGGHMGIARL